MQSTTKISCLFASTLALILCLLSAMPAAMAGSAAQNTTFLPLKINAPDPGAIAPRVDKIMDFILREKGLTMMPRQEAEKLVDYRASWPPLPAVLTRVAEKTGLDYVAAGSLTMIGDQISVDMQVYDALAPQNPHLTYREGTSADMLTTVLEETVADVLGYTNRAYLVASIAPAGNHRIDSGAILNKISTKPGDFYDPLRLRQDLKAVFSMGYFDDVTIEAQDTPDGKAITFRVKEKPVITRISFKGNDKVELDEIREASGIQTSTILNPSRVNQAVKRIKGLYRAKGFFNPRVTANLSYPDRDSVEITFNIDEGTKMKIRKIVFQGNKSFDDDDLQDVIETGTWSWLTSWVTETGVLRMDVLRQDAARLAVFYHNHGFIEAKVGEPVIEDKDGSLTIVFPIEEGPRYRVGLVDIQGDLVEDKDKILSMLKIRREEFLNRQVLRDDTMRLTDLFAEHGYAFAEVRPKINKSTTGKRVNIMFQVDKGSLVYFNRVEIQGNTRTRDNVIRRDLKVREGGVFDSRAIRESTRKLQRLGFFEEVKVTPQPTLQENLMDVVVSVKEKPTGQFSIGAGYSSSEYLTLMGEISENNLFGTGNRLALSANLSGTTTRYNLSFTNPRLFDSQVMGGIDVYNWSKEYDDYTKDSTGFGLRLGHPLWKKWRISYGYSFSHIVLSDIQDTTSSIILLSEDINYISSVQVALVRDTRDMTFDTRSGSRNEISIKHAGVFLGGDAEFTKIQGASSWFFPLPWDTVFHVKGAAGQIFTGNQDKLPVYEHFYLGGMNSIRGFKSSKISPIDSATGDRIGGDKMWYANFEYIFPLLTDAGLRGVAFTDFGNVYATWEDWDVSDFKKTAGIGVRWMSPMGPLRLVLGFNLDPRDDEDSSVWDFSIGGMF
ncbi:outer membrane protein assembly factor BamA [Desulfolithobacter sp.]